MEILNGLTIDVRFTVKLDVKRGGDGATIHVGRFCYNADEKPAAVLEIDGRQFVVRVLLGVVHAVRFVNLSVFDNLNIVYLLAGRQRQIQFQRQQRVFAVEFRFPFENVTGREPVDRRRDERSVGNDRLPFFQTFPKVRNRPLGIQLDVNAIVSKRVFGLPRPRPGCRRNFVPAVEQMEVNALFPFDLVFEVWIQLAVVGAPLFRDVHVCPSNAGVENFHGINQPQRDENRQVVHGDIGAVNPGVWILLFYRLQVADGVRPFGFFVLRQNRRRQIENVHAATGDLVPPRHRVDVTAPSGG